MRVAGVITAVLFVGWLATLSVRLAGLEVPVVQNSGANAASALVAVGEVAGTQNGAESAGWLDFFKQFGL